jgi:hypothetical protein
MGRKQGVLEEILTCRSMRLLRSTSSTDSESAKAILYSSCQRPQALVLLGIAPTQMQDCSTADSWLLCPQTCANQQQDNKIFVKTAQPRAERWGTSHHPVKRIGCRQFTSSSSRLRCCCCSSLTIDCGTGTPSSMVPGGRFTPSSAGSPRERDWDWDCSSEGRRNQECGFAMWRSLWRCLYPLMLRD